MTSLKPRTALVLAAVCAALLAATTARSQLPIPQEQFTYKPCLVVKMKTGQTVKVPTRCAKRDGQTKISIILKGGVTSANIRVSGVGEFRVSRRHKPLLIHVGTTITLLRMGSLGGPGGVYLIVLDYSKPIPKASVWDNEDPLTRSQPE